MESNQQIELDRAALISMFSCISLCVYLCCLTTPTSCCNKVGSEICGQTRCQPIKCHLLALIVVPVQQQYECSRLRQRPALKPLLRKTFQSLLHPQITLVGPLSLPCRLSARQQQTRQRLPH